MIEKLMWCDDCEELYVTNRKKKCPTCKATLEEVGSIESAV